MWSTPSEPTRSGGAQPRTPGPDPEASTPDVLEVFADATSRPRIVTLALRNMPTSGTPAEPLAQAGIDRDEIVTTVRSVVQQATANLLTVERR